MLCVRSVASDWSSDD